MTPPVVQLRVLMGETDLGSQRLERFPATLGSAAGNGLQLLGAQVAAVHVTVSLSPHGVVVERSDPQAPVHVNGHPVERVLVGVGDQVQVGPYRLVVEHVPAAGGEPASDATAPEIPAMPDLPPPEPAVTPGPGPLTPLPPGVDRDAGTVVTSAGDMPTTFMAGALFYSRWQRWQFPACVGASAVVQLGTLLLILGLAPVKPPSREEALKHVVAGGRFIQLVAMEPVTAAAQAAAERHRAKAKGKKGRKARRRRRPRPVVPAQVDGWGGRGSPGGKESGKESGGGKLSRLFAGARHAAGGAIDLSAGGASGHSGAGGSLDALASSLPGGTGGAGAAGLAAGGGSFDGLVRGGGRKGRRGGARVGGRLSGGKGMSVRGSLARSKVRKTVSRHYSKLRRCYLNRLQTRPGLQGRIVVHFVIGSSGRVERVSSFDSIGDGALKRCVENRFRMMRFDKPKRGVVHVNWPLTFRAG